ncbi:terminase small subunit [Echinicola marina]|uniref:terminase small subunit n=1 Tax=Echinicola marina TaxID=2859768 RepID=UPI001CF633F9|nr:terminase small subunit [Echinicola marina]UCS93769.1 terminase small subunit [Echinicola marina]
MKHQQPHKKETDCLTDKENLFVTYYCKSYNAADAARKAGYSPRLARQQGYENMAKPHIKKLIEREKDRVYERLAEDQEKVLQELETIAFSRITDFVNHDFTLKSLGQINPSKVAAIKDIRVNENGFRIILHNKLRALKILLDMMNVESE